LWGITGFESAANLEVTDCGCCIYLDCQDGCAANALHCGVAQRLDMALNDIELQRVFVAWGRLSVPVKSAILALVESQRMMRSGGLRFRLTALRATGYLMSLFLMKRSLAIAQPLQQITCIESGSQNLILAN